MLKNFICGTNCEIFIDKFLNAMKDGFLLSQLIRDIDGNITDSKILNINEAFEELFGVNRNDILQKSVSEIFPHNIQAWFDTYIHNSLDWISVQSDIYFESMDKHFRINLIKELNDMYIVLISDITETVKANDQLAKYFMLFENAKDIILYLKSDFSIFDANKTAVDKYGYSKEELLKLKLIELRHPDTLKDFESQMKISAETGVMFESVHVKKDGSSFPVEVSSKTVNVNGENVRIHIIRDISDRKKSEEKIKYFADYDALTGIYNRGFFMYLFRKMLEQASAEKKQFAVLLFDIDRFKYINDTYGHAAGDEVLKEVARRLSGSVRKSDIIGRLGGDEFIVLQPFIRDVNDSFVLSKKLLDNIAKPLTWEGITFNVRISIGISIYPDSSDNMKGLLQCADSAMYSVKQYGGNSYNY